MSVDQRQHRHAEQAGEIGAGRRAVEQAHDAFDQDQIGLLRGLIQQRLAVTFADHPQIELIDWISRSSLQDHRIEKVRSGFEHPHPAALIAVITSESGGDGGFTLAGGRGGEQQSGAGGGHEFKVNNQRLKDKSE